MSRPLTNYTQIGQPVTVALTSVMTEIDPSSGNIGSIDALQVSTGSGACHLVNISSESHRVITIPANTTKLIGWIGSVFVRGSGTTTITAYQNNLVSRVELRTNNSIAVVGDSISSTGQDTNGGLALNGANYGWVAIQKANGNLTSVARFQYAGCFGVGGNTTAQIYARYQTVRASGARIDILLAGENNNTSSPTQTQYTVWFSNIVNYIKQAEADGVTVVLGDLVPATDAVQDSAIAVVFYRMIGWQYGLPCFSCYNWSVDANTGTFISGYSADNIHPNATGIGVWSDQLYPQLNSLASMGPIAYFCYANVTTTANSLGLSPNLIANGTFYTQSGGSPSSWTVTAADGNNVLSAPAATLPWTGKTQTLVKTNTAQFKFYQICTGFSAGDTLYFSGGFSCTGLDLTTTTGIEIYLQFRDSGTGNLSKFSPAYVWNANGSFAFADTCVVPASAADVQVLIYIDGVATYTFNNFTLINLTKFQTVAAPWLY